MKTRKLAVPAALVLSGCGSNGPCTRQPLESVVICTPDGGYVCGSADCAAEKLPDGGPQRDASGAPVCMC